MYNENNMSVYKYMLISESILYASVVYGLVKGVKKKSTFVRQCVLLSLLVM